MNENDLDGLPSVKSLALRLKEHISGFKGGPEAVWKQIDTRLKDEDSKTIEGLKSKKLNKIRKAAFMKAYQRLGAKEDSERLERMTFQINGNPVLLMNIFKILGLKGYEDLLSMEYKRPDYVDEIVNIDKGIEIIKKKIETLNNNIENNLQHSINTLKLCANFEEILNRIYTIINEKTDPAYSNPSYIQNLLEKSNKNLGMHTIKTEKDLLKNYKLRQTYLKNIESQKYFNILSLFFINRLV
jgi:hypothetical protein